MACPTLVIRILAAEPGCRLTFGRTLLDAHLTAASLSPALALVSHSATVRHSAVLALIL